MVAHGESASSTLAEKIAMQNAQTNLATRINSLVKNGNTSFSTSFNLTLYSSVVLVVSEKEQSADLLFS
mgnify:CR=1 FL=1